MERYLSSVLAGSLPMLAYVLPVAFLLLVRSWTRRRHESRFRSPLTSELLREPGHGLRVQIEDARFDAGAAAGMASSWLVLPLLSGLFLAWWESRPLGWQDGLLAILMFLMITSMGLREYLKAIRTLRPLKLGWEAEVAVGQELNHLMLRGCRVYHDLQAGKFNIDHVVIGPNGVFAVETKGRSKPHGDNGHKVSLRDDALHFPNGTDRESMPQARRQAKWLAQRLSEACGEPVEVMPTLVLPGWYLNLEQRPPFPILSGKQVRTTLLKWGSTTLDAAQVQRIAHQVEQLCRQPV